MQTSLEPTTSATSTTIRTTDWRTSLWRHALVYFWLLFATWSVLLHSPSAVRSWLSLTLVVGLGAWYWRWQVARPPGSAQGTWGGSPDRVYVLGGLPLWLALTLLDPTFVVAGVAVLAPYCFGSVRWALISLVPCTGAWLWQSASHGELDWAQVTVALAVVASGVGVSGYIGSLTRQNTVRQQLIDQLQATQDDLAAAERRAGMLAERHRLARDIHDTLTQGFASIVMLLEAAEASLEAGDTPTRHVAQALRAARDNLAESRRLIWALRPVALAGGQLSEALGDLLARLEDESGPTTELVVTGTPHDLAQEEETALLRLAQEALSNARKHARASRVTVTVSYMDDVVVLDVQDDGVGFDPASLDLHRGLGRRAMRERAQELGGRLTIETAPGEGTTVMAEIPIQPRPTGPDEQADPVAVGEPMQTSHPVDASPPEQSTPPDRPIPPDQPTPLTRTRP